MIVGRLSRSGTVAAAFAAAILFLAVAAPLLAPFPPLLTGAGPSMVPPGATHLMGTDDLGRDIWSGVVYGARVSLGVGFAAAIASTAIGLLIGLVAGYRGGITDVLLMRVSEVFFVVPMVFLAILLVAFFGSSLWNVIGVIIVLSWPSTARLVRGQVLSLKERPFVVAAHTLGESSLFIMTREIMPNVMAPVLASAALQVAHAIVVEAGLSFLGLGDPTLISWGVMLFRAQRFLMQDAWWTFTFPGVALFLTVLALTKLSDELNRFLDPRAANA